MDTEIPLASTGSQTLTPPALGQRPEQHSDGCGTTICILIGLPGPQFKRL